MESHWELNGSIGQFKNNWKSCLFQVKICFSFVLGIKILDSSNWALSLHILFSFDQFIARWSLVAEKQS